MPRTPDFAQQTLSMSGSAFSPIAKRMQQVPGGVFELHVGDTWMEPFTGGRMEDLREADHPGLHRYCDPRGIPDLVDAIVEKVRGSNGLPCERESVLVTAGATGAMSAAVGAVTSPGDEVLILAPYWPLIRGVVASFRATPVEVPFYDRVTTAEAAVEAVLERLTPRTVALYVSTPSNPTGHVLPSGWLEALAEWAADEGLWLLSDEVYEDYVYRGEHVSVGRFAPDRTITAFSFSKAYGMAGNRTGYLVAPAAAIDQALKISTHTAYAAPTSGQVAALSALRDGRVERGALGRRQQRALRPELIRRWRATTIRPTVRIAGAACEFDIIAAPRLRPVAARGAMLAACLQAADARFARAVVLRRVRRRDERPDAMAAQPCLHRMA